MMPKSSFSPITVHSGPAATFCHDPRSTTTPGSMMMPTKQHMTMNKPINNKAANKVSNSIRSRKSKATSMRPGNFVEKLHQMMQHIETHGLHSIITWVEQGRAFKLNDPDALVEILPLFFDLTKYRSFRRQLCMWHFKRVVSGPLKGSFFHPYFRQGQPDICRNVSRNAFKAAILANGTLQQMQQQAQKAQEECRSAASSPCENQSQPINANQGQQRQQSSKVSPSSRRGSPVESSWKLAPPRFEFSTLDLQPVPFRLPKHFPTRTPPSAFCTLSSASSLSSSSSLSSASSFESSPTEQQPETQQLRSSLFEDAVMNLSSDLFELDDDELISSPPPLLSLEDEVHSEATDPFFRSPTECDFEDGDLLGFEGRQFYYVGCSPVV